MADDTQPGGAPDTLDELLAAVAGELGLAWRPGDDPAPVLRALEDRAGALPDELQQALAATLDAAGALERELASPHTPGQTRGKDDG